MWLADSAGGGADFHFTLSANDAIATSTPPRAAVTRA
jgi:hypothetical protein